MYTDDLMNKSVHCWYQKKMLKFHSEKVCSYLDLISQLFSFLPQLFQFTHFSGLLQN